MASALISPRSKAPRLEKSGVGDQVEGRVVLHDVPWDVYCALRDNEANNGVRMTYDEGSLELVSPSFRHERSTSLLGRFVQVWTEESEIPLCSARSTTFKIPGRRKGLEADDCFYMLHEALIRNLTDIDLRLYPPPELAVEVDLSSPSLSKLPIYKAMKVPEIWLWREGRIQVMLLQDNGDYVESDDSRCFPGFPFREAERLIEQRGTADDNSLAKQFRDYVRQLRAIADQAPPAEEPPVPKRRRPIGRKRRKS